MLKYGQLLFSRIIIAEQDSFFMRRPVRGNQLLAQHPGRAGEHEKKTSPARSDHRPCEETSCWHSTRAARWEGKTASCFDSQEILREKGW